MLRKLGPERSQRTPISTSCPLLSTTTIDHYSTKPPLSHLAHYGTRAEVRRASLRNASGKA